MPYFLTMQASSTNGVVQNGKQTWHVPQGDTVPWEILSRHAGLRPDSDAAVSMLEEHAAGEKRHAIRENPIPGMEGRCRTIHFPSHQFHFAGMTVQAWHIFLLTKQFLLPD